MKTTFGKLKPGDFFIRQKAVMMKTPFHNRPDVVHGIEDDPRLAIVIKDLRQDSGHPGSHYYLHSDEEVEKLVMPVWVKSEEDASI